MPQPHTAKIIVWDFDGTLAFREGLWSEALAEVARANIPGCDWNRKDFSPYLQAGFFWHSSNVPHTHIRSEDEWWEHLFPTIATALIKVTSISQVEAIRLLPAVRATFVDIKYWAVFDDVLPCLQALSNDGWKHVVLSNHVPELPLLIKGLGLDDHITRIFNSAVIGYEKPHPLAFEAVRVAFPEVTSIWMIGDNYAVDIHGATSVGIPAILVRKPHPAAACFHESLATIPQALSVSELSELSKPLGTR